MTELSKTPKSLIPISLNDLKNKHFDNIKSWKDFIENSIPIIEKAKDSHREKVYYLGNGVLMVIHGYYLDIDNWGVWSTSR